MSTGSTSRRWVGRIAAASAVAAAGVGLSSGVAVAAVPAGTAPTATHGQVPTQAIQSDAAASARRAWETRGRPDHLTIVRPDRIDLVNSGRLTSQIPRRLGPVTLSDLQRSLPAGWLKIADGTAVLDSSIVLVSGSVLEVGGPSDDTVRTLQLTGGDTTAETASLHTGGGQIKLTGVTVSSLDPASGQPVAATAAGRPMIVASGGGQLDLTDATITDLGTPAAGPDKNGDAGVAYHSGSTGSVTRTTFQRNTIGLELSKTDGVKLDTVTIDSSAYEGLILAGDRDTTMTGIQATNNGSDGVLVSGSVSSDRPVIGITTSGNSGYGVAVVDQTGLQLSGISTRADRDGGLEVSRSTNINVTDFTGADQRIGVFTHVGSSGIVLDGVHTTGGSRGIVVEKSTSSLQLRNSTFTGPRVTGVSINGHDIALDGVQVSDSDYGVRVERGAANIQLTGLTVAGGQDGVVTAPATTGVVMSGLTISDFTGDGIRTFSPNGRITDTHIDGGSTGIDVAAGTTISNSEITAAEEGIHSRSPDQVYASQVAVDTTELGVNSTPGSPFLLDNSQVHALESVRGQVALQGVNDLSLPPLNLLGAIGIPLIVLAVVLEEIHRLRQRRLGTTTTRRQPPLPLGMV